MKPRFKIAIPIIISIAIVFGLIMPIPVHAIIESIIGNIAIDLLSRLIELIQGALSLLVHMGAAAMEGMLKVGFKKEGIDIVKTGWTLTRDIANMLFILFMIVIAFATILRKEEYGVKKLLPKVIWVALLINFSMVFCYIIIDFTNMFANFFMQGIDKELDGKSITGTFNAATKISTMMVGLDFTDCDTPWTQAREICHQKKNSGELDPGREYTNCLKEAEKAQQKCEELKTKIANQQKGTWQNVLSVLISGIIGSIALLVVAFTFFAGAIMLIIRMVVIWFLVMLAPLVYICYIMPSLSSNWKKWWHTFLNYCFFAPAYAFFVWLAIKVANNNTANRIASGIEGSSQFAYSQGSTNPFILNPLQELLNYGFIIGLLIGGLIVAKNLGIYGANTAMNIANKARKGATDWAKRTTMKPVTYTGAKVLEGTGKLFGGKLGRRMEAKALQMLQKPAESPENKKYAALLKTMTNENIYKEIETAWGVRKLIAVREAQKRGILRESERGTIRKAMKAMQAFGASEDLRSLEELRSDAIEDKIKRNAAIERAIKEGAHKKWSAKAFESPEGVEVIKELRKQLGNTEFIKAFKGWGTEIQKMATIALKNGFSTKFDDSDDGKDNMSTRRAYASITGELDKAFEGYDKDNALRGELEKYITAWGSEDFGVLNRPEAKSSRKIVVEFMKPSQVEGAAIKLSGAVKEQMIDLARKLPNTKVYEQMQKSLGWGVGGTPRKVI